MHLKHIEKVFIDQGFVFKHYKSVSSTMIKIKELFNNNNIVVIADSQTNGKGRRGSIWFSPKGNIYLSFMIKMGIDIKHHFIFNALTTLSISKAIDYICNVNSRIKWPNDIIVNKKKISGVMTEIYNHNSDNYVIIGLGINVASSPKILDYPTTFVKEFNLNANKQLVIDLFIKNFFKYINIIQKSIYIDILKEFKTKLLYLNKKITLQTDQSNYIYAVFKDINLDGSMVININGEIKNIYSARIINEK